MLFSELRGILGALNHYENIFIVFESASLFEFVWKIFYIDGAIKKGYKMYHTSKT